MFINREGAFSELRLNQTIFVEPPSVMDVNGDGISDVLGLSKVPASSSHTLVCFNGSRTTIFESCTNNFVGGDFAAGPYLHFPHIFVDIDGDLSSEIVFGMSDAKVMMNLQVFKKWDE